MGYKLIIEEDAVYEIDEECLKKKELREKKEQEKKDGQRKERMKRAWKNNGQRYR